MTDTEEVQKDEVWRCGAVGKADTCDAGIAWGASPSVDCSRTAGKH